MRKVLRYVQAQFLYLHGHRFRLLVRGVLHAQLYPAASPFGGHPAESRYEYVSVKCVMNCSLK